MKRYVIWALTAVLFVAGFSQMGGRGGGGLQLERITGIVYAMLFALMNVGYLNAIRGRRFFRLNEIESANPIHLDGQPLTGWSRAKIRVSLEKLCYVQLVARPFYLIVAVLLLWLVAAVCAAMALPSNPMALKAVVVGATVLGGAIHVYLLTRKTLLLGTCHGSEDVFLSRSSDLGELLDQMEDALGPNRAQRYRDATVGIESDVVLHRNQITTVESSHRIRWGWFIMGVLLIACVPITERVEPGIIALLVIIVGIVLSLSQSVVRFEGGAELSIPRAQAEALRGDG